MILTGEKIKRELHAGKILIEPFSESQLNPNSYNYRLGSVIKKFKYFDGEHSQFEEVIIPDSGIVLVPGYMYLGHTAEIIGSKQYAMSLIGRSSMGRYGLFLQLSANLGHTSSSHKWTLELCASMPIRLYPGMVIGQVSFWENCGEIRIANHHYSKFNEPHESLGLGVLS